MPSSRKEPSWLNILKALVCYRLIEHKRKAVEMLGKVLSGNQSEKRLHNLFTFSESDSDTTSCKSLRDMVGDIGLEPMTPCL